MAEAEPGEPVDKEAKKKGEAITAAKCEKHRRKRQVKKKQAESAGEEGNAGKLTDLETPVTPQKKLDAGSRLAAKAENRDAGKLTD